MAGIYIHIPFCRQACHYCDFHFSTNLKTQDEMVASICQELSLRSDYLNERIDTIYFGGGTPSILSEAQLAKIFESVHNSFEVSSLAEVTLEANPEDLDGSKLRQLIHMGVNRLSIGFQTFNNSSLAWMNRAHNAEQAKNAFLNARAYGINNISIDLIYALPKVGNENWGEDLEKALDLSPDHISLYGLTIEDRTVFGYQKKKGELIELPEEDAANQYLHAIQKLKDHGYNQYEVSNFCRRGFESKHNGSYWGGVNYLGVGPGAHSYNGYSRQFNIRNNAKYIRSISKGESFSEIEQLSINQQLNEHILTGLRTAKGISFETIQSKFEVNLKVKYSEILDRFQKMDLVNVSNDNMSLTSKGFLVADDIALQLFFQE